MFKYNPQNGHKLITSARHFVCLGVVLLFWKESFSLIFYFKTNQNACSQAVILITFIMYLTQSRSKHEFFRFCFPTYSIWFFILKQILFYFVFLVGGEEKHLSKRQIGAAMLLHKYASLLCAHVGEILPVASSVAAIGPRYKSASFPFLIFFQFLLSCTPQE